MLSLVCRVWCISDKVKGLFDRGSIWEILLEASSEPKTMHFETQAMIWGPGLADGITKFMRNQGVGKTICGFGFR